MSRRCSAGPPAARTAGDITRGSELSARSRLSVSSGRSHLLRATDLAPARPQFPSRVGEWAELFKPGVCGVRVGAQWVSSGWPVKFSEAQFLPPNSGSRLAGAPKGGGPCVRMAGTPRARSMPPAGRPCHRERTLGSGLPQAWPLPGPVEAEGWGCGRQGDPPPRPQPARAGRRPALHRDCCI